MKKDNWFFDKNFNGVPDDVLDNVGGFFDFQLDDAETDDVMDMGEDWNAQFNNLEEPSLGVFPISSSIGLSGQTQNENPQPGGSFPASVLRTAEPTNGKTVPIKIVSLNGTDLNQFKTYSPVSVFEVPVIPAKRPRGKRLRRSNFSKLSIIFSSTSTAIQKNQRTADSKSDFQKNRRTVDSKSDFERQPAGKSSSRYERRQTKREQKKKPSSKESVVSRKCTHCEMTETPQWRLGPMGPKTLCNACGVRYRSGRLFPEYRPAASPTFVASLHSNSHKKVLEMRNNASGETIEGSSVYYLASDHPGNSQV